MICWRVYFTMLNGNGDGHTHTESVVISEEPDEVLRRTNNYLYSKGGLTIVHMREISPMEYQLGLSINPAEGETSLQLHKNDYRG